MGWRGRLPLGLLFFGFATLAVASCPTVCVIIPETVIIERILRPIPDLASETAIIKAFLSYGFHVVNQAQVKSLRMTEAELVERARKGALRQSTSFLSVSLRMCTSWVRLWQPSPSSGPCKYRDRQGSEMNFTYWKSLVSTNLFWVEPSPIWSDLCYQC